MFALLIHSQFLIICFSITCNNKIFVFCIYQISNMDFVSIRVIVELVYSVGGCQFTWWHRDNHLFRCFPWNSNAIVYACAGTFLVVTCYILFLPPVGCDKWWRLAVGDTVYCMAMLGRNVPTLSRRTLRAEGKPNILIYNIQLWNVIINQIQWFFGGSWFNILFMDSTRWPENRLGSKKNVNVKMGHGKTSS